MSGFDWQRANRREAARRDARPLLELDPLPPAPPTPKQLAYIEALARRACVPTPSVKSKREASAAIERLRAMRPPTRRQLRRIDELATETGIRFPLPTTKDDAERDLDALTALRGGPRS